VDAAIAESSPTPAPEGQQDASGDDGR